MQTQRLLLRRFRAEDFDDFLACFSDPEVVRFEPYEPMSPEDARNALQSRIGSDEFIAVERRSDGRIIGNVYLGRRDFQALELGYVFSRDCWGQGYAQESCSAAIEAAFAAGVHRIFSECDPQNAASWRLLERLGFAREAHLRQNVFFHTDPDGHPIWKDTFIYSRLSPSEQ